MRERDVSVLGVANYGMVSNGEVKQAEEEKWLLPGMRERERNGDELKAKSSWV